MTTSRIQIGSPVACRDAPCGTVVRIMIEPTARVITHLAVRPRHGGGRLVPFAYATPTEDGISLACTKAEFDAFLSDQDRELVSDPTGADPNQRGDLTTLILFDAVAPGVIGRQNLIPDRTPATQTFDRVPTGTEQLQPAEQVRATDGPVGHVSGLGVDVATHRITYLLVSAGHLWGKRQIAVPIGDVEHIGIAVQIGLTRQQMGDLDQIG